MEFFVIKNKSPPLRLQRRALAEKEGFEPPEVLPSTVFKTAAIDHSAISPAAKVLNFLFQKQKVKKKVNFSLTSSSLKMHNRLEI